MMVSGEVFSLIDELQQLHGLRVDDYVRYRRYCTRKLERLRSKFNLKQTKTLQVKISEDAAKANPEILHLFLFKCEWYLAQINILRNELEINSRKKFHLRLICQNSLKCIEKLTLLSQQLKDSDYLNYLAYCNLFKGIVLNEMKDFCPAYNSFERSKVIIEELIKSKEHEESDLMSDSDAVLKKKLNEIETFMRVCQYSADMYDVIITPDETMNDFKVNQLSEKLLKSNLKQTYVTQLKFGRNVITLTPSISLSDPTYKNVQLSRRLCSSDKNVSLQVGYFENRHFGNLMKRQFKLIKKGKQTEIDTERIFKILLRSKGHNSDPNYMRFIDLFCNFLKAVKDSNKVKEAIELIRLNEEILKEYKIKFLLLILKNEKLINKNICAINTTITEECFIPSGLVSPKPFFYDMALDCITLNNEDLSEKKSSGFGNLLSSFWGKK